MAAVSTQLPDVPRWELYRLLADPVRVRLLALAAAEELAMGELAELLGESQPKVSRHGAALRDAGLVTGRKHGTWVLVRIAPGVEADPVVQDALRAGRELLSADGTLARVEHVVKARDEKAREFFARVRPAPDGAGTPGELHAYLSALGPLLGRRGVAVDAGTGDGSLLEVLAPLFDHVVALDRSEAQLEVAAARSASRGLDNVRFVCGELDGPEVVDAVRALCPAGADLVFASRVLHHAPKPARAVQALGDLLRRAPNGGVSGALIVLDYEPHEDLAFKEAQADLWLGFARSELEGFAEGAGLSVAGVRSLPLAFHGDGPDKHLGWHAVIARPSPTQVPDNPSRTPHRGTPPS